MSANDVVSGQQFYGRDPDQQGHMTAEEFTAKFHPGEDETWEHTARRVRGTERYQALIDNPERMKKPVAVHNTWVANGHHRVVAAMMTGQPLRFEHWQDAESPSR